MNLAQGDEVPQIITRITRQRPAESLTTCAKRLLQHNRPKADIVAVIARADKLGLGQTLMDSALIGEPGKVGKHRRHEVVVMRIGRG